MKDSKQNAIHYIKRFSFLSGLFISHTISRVTIYHFEMVPKVRLQQKQQQKKTNIPKIIKFRHAAEEKKKTSHNAVTPSEREK